MRWQCAGSDDNPLSRLEKTFPIWQKLGASWIEVFVTIFTKDDYNW
jgi:hypothetical protein